MLRRLALLIALVAAGPALAETGHPSVTLANRSSYTILEAYVSLASEDIWGPDRVTTEVVRPGQTLAVVLPEGDCTYDVRIIYQGGPPPEERRRVDLCRTNELVFTGAPPREGPRRKGEPAERARATGNPSFNIVNHSGQVIAQAYVSAAVMADWGPDVLGTEVLEPDAHIAIRLPEGDCSYDIKIVYQNGRNEERRGVNTCDIANVVFP